MAQYLNLQNLSDKSRLIEQNHNKKVVSNIIKQIC